LGLTLTPNPTPLALRMPRTDVEKGAYAVWPLVYSPSFCGSGFRV
jgi:hypothetical protein